MRPVPSRRMRQAAKGPGLSGRGNRVLLGLVAGWLAWLIANTAEAPGNLPVIFGVLVAGLGYVLLTLWVSRRAS